MNSAYHCDMVAPSQKAAVPPELFTRDSRLDALNLPVVEYGLQSACTVAEIDEYEAVPRPSNRRYPPGYQHVFVSQSAQWETIRVVCGVRDASETFRLDEARPPWVYLNSGRLQFFCSFLDLFGQPSGQRGRLL